MLNQNDRYKTYIMNLEILAPTFIGGGENSLINKSQYIYDKKQRLLKVIDEYKWAQFLDRYGLFDLFHEYLKRNSNKPIDIFEWIDMIKNRIKLKFNNQEINKCIKYSIDVGNIDSKELNDVNRFIRNGMGLPYIPGSSIKGALRTIIIATEIMRNKHEYSNYLKEIMKNIEPKVRKKELSYIIKNIESKALKNNKNIKRLQGLSISDTRNIDNNDLILLQKVDLTLTRKKEDRHKLPIYREYIKPNTILQFSIGIDTVLLREINIKNFDDLIRRINEFSNLLIGKNGIFRVFNKLNEYLPSKANELDANLLFLGGGSGFHTKTLIGALAQDDREILEITKKILHKSNKNGILSHRGDNIISPRTLKLANYKSRDQIVGLCNLKQVD